MVEKPPKKTDAFGFIFYVPILLITLQACAKSEFGRQLENSFDAPILSSSLAEPKILGAKKTPSDIQPIKKKPTQKSEEVKLLKEKPPNISISKPVGKPKKLEPEKVVPFTPHPYRITIQLSGADPAAPAEVVTKALRMSGVSFAVEKIERIQVNNSFKSKVSGLKLKP